MVGASGSNPTTDTLTFLIYKLLELTTILKGYVQVCNHPGN